MLPTLKSLRSGARGIGTAAVLTLALAGIGTAVQANGPVKALYTFSGTDGAQPLGGLIAGPDGMLYGVTDAALTSGDSTTTDVVYKVRQDGTGYQILHTFSGTSNGVNTDGSAPNQLLLVNGFLYGTTYTGGTNGTGVIFKMDTLGGAFQILHSFSALTAPSINTDGAGATAGLTAGPNGSFYGTTSVAGTSGGGGVYRINPDGTGFQVIYSFPTSSGASATGSQPGTVLTYSAGTGLLYGTTSAGGANSVGTVFKMTLTGQSFGVLHNFDFAGGYSSLGVIAASDGNLYGTNFFGGPSGNNAGGTLFQLTPSGTYQVLRSFTTGTGQTAIPLTPLTEAPDGTLYGGTNGGGTTGLGVIYQVNKDGSNFQIAGSLSQATGVSLGGPLLITNQKVYGTARAGGANSDGTLISLALPSNSHILWRNTNGAQAIWTVQPNYSFTNHDYGPYTGWSAQAIADTPDGHTHLAWNHSPDGQVALWDVAQDGTFHDTYFGPYAGWSAQALSAGPDGRLHLLWNHSPDNQMSLWAINTDGTSSYRNYGPFPGWSAKGVATGGDGITDVLWNNANGMMSTWKVSEGDGSYVYHNFGPYAGWTANAVAAGVDGTGLIAWGNTNGTQALWSEDFGSGSFSAMNEGPFGTWGVVSVAVGADGVRHLLWNHGGDNRAALWSLDGSGGYTHAEYGPYAGWSAVGLSAGQ